MHRDVSERGFTDVQAEGPALRWEHTHTFTPLTPTSTQIKEHIEYEHRKGLWGILTQSALCQAQPVLHVHLSQVDNSLEPATCKIPSRNSALTDCVTAIRGRADRDAIAQDLDGICQA